MNFLNRLADNQEPSIPQRSSRVRIQRPDIKNSQEEQIWREVLKYTKLVPDEPEPNMGRVQEIKEEIKNGTYLTSEKIEETAARIAIRLSKRED